MPTGFIKQQQIPDLKCCCFHPALNEFVHSGHSGLPHSEQKNPCRDKPCSFFPFLLRAEWKDSLSRCHAEAAGPVAQLSCPDHRQQWRTSLQAAAQLWGSADALCSFGKENRNVRRSYHFISYLPGHFTPAVTNQQFLRVVFLL